MTRFEKVRIALLLIVVGSIMFLAALMASYSLPVQDLAQYWAAAHLIGKNPYSMPLAVQFEHSAGIGSTPLIIKMPPWAVVLVLPLGILGYHSSFAIWALMSVVIISGSTYLVGHGLFPGTSLAPVALPFIFGPTFVLLMLGQFTVLVLLGVVLFCYLVRRRHDWLAGASLLFVLAKPHVPLLFLIAIVLWVVHTKRRTILISASLALTSASLLAVLINHHIFEQFWQRSILVVHETESYPNLGGGLYEVSGIHGLALLPQIAGVLWVLFYWKKHRTNWAWEREGALVLLVSVACSYYSYPYDEILALPALLSAFAMGNRRAFVIAFALTDIGYAVYLSNVAGSFGYGYMFLWWTALGWLAAYLLAQTQFLAPKQALGGD